MEAREDVAVVDVEARPVGGRDYWGPDTKGMVHFNCNGVNFCELRNEISWQNLTSDKEKRDLIEKFRRHEERIIEWKFSHLLCGFEYSFWKKSCEVEDGGSSQHGGKHD
jgi:hypothetical protein